MKAPRSPGATHLLVRIARVAALAIVIGWGLVNAWQHISTWSLSDMDAYWNAALRVRDGAALYPPLPDPSAADVYRYAPWFAWAWVPLTFLPKALVAVAWSGVLVAASVAALRPVLARTATSLAVASLLGGFLIWAASVGNVQPLIVASLVNGMDRRSGPLWIGFSASLKAVPILFALVYVGRGEWRRAGLAVAITAVLVLPMLFTPLANYPASSGDAPTPLLAIWPPAFLVVAVIAAAIAIRVAMTRSRFTRLSAVAASLAALPRITLLDLSYLLVGIAPRPPKLQP